MRSSFENFNYMRTGGLEMGNTDVMDWLLSSDLEILDI